MRLLDGTCCCSVSLKGLCWTMCLCPLYTFKRQPISIPGSPFPWSSGPAPLYFELTWSPAQSQPASQSVLGALVEARAGWQQFRKLTPPPPPKQLSFYSKHASFTPRLAGNEDLTGVPPCMGSISLLFKLVCKDMKAGHDHGGLS